MTEHFNNKGERLEEWFEAHLDAERIAWINNEVNRKLSDLREIRNDLLTKTDWWASGDLVMTDAQKKYRKDLRDLTNGLDKVEKISNVIWPTKP